MPAQHKLEWRETDSGLTPVVLSGKMEIGVAWAAQPGAQVAMLSCPVFEALGEGNRGGMKTDTLLMCFAQHCGVGFGSEWRGILFRRTYKELEDVINKTLKWIPRIWPRAKFNHSEHTWTWPEGERLLLRYFMHPRDYEHYHGHSFAFVGFEELTRWPDDKCYKPMFSCCRSPRPGIPMMIRSTTNPYGVGHSWVKKRFRLPSAPGQTIGKVIRDSRDLNGEIEPERVAIHFDLRENKILLSAHPDYLKNVKAAARNASEYQAWVHGDWDIVAGGMFDDVWDPPTHVVPNFPLHLIPATWYINRSYDHGQSKPFSVGWWAESNGEPFQWEGKWYGQVPGDLFRIAEWYGWDGEENSGVRMLARSIAEGIVERERDWGLAGRVHRGPADTSIWDDDASGETSVYGEMLRVGVDWDRADKTRKQGWEQLRKMLKDALGTQREHPGIFALERCEQFRRTFPILPRSDKDLDDVDTESEDHIGDECRYRVRHRRRMIRTGVFQ